MNVQFRSQLGRPLSMTLYRVIAPKDAYGAKQQDTTDSETILLPSLDAFPVPLYHEVLEKRFLLAVTSMWFSLIYGCETLELEGLDSYSGFKGDILSILRCMWFLALVKIS